MEVGKRPDPRPLAAEALCVRLNRTADHVILRRWIVDGLDQQTLRTLRGRPRVYDGPPRVYGPR